MALLTTGKMTGNRADYYEGVADGREDYYAESDRATGPENDDAPGGDDTAAAADPGAGGSTSASPESEAGGPAGERARALAGCRRRRARPGRQPGAWRTLPACERHAPQDRGAARHA